MKSKKLAALFLTFIMAVGLMTGCGASDEKQAAFNNDQTSNVSETASEEAESEEPEAVSESTTEAETVTEQTSAEGGKTLVVYFSASGSTRGVAEKVAKITEADLFEVEPVETYTDDDLNWTNDDSRVSREHDDESLRDVELVSTSVENWDSYDTVYIGYPIWWGDAPRIMSTFVESHSFEGKTVVPFCTSGSSSIGRSGSNLAAQAGSGNWLDGERFSGSVTEDEIQSWIDGLS